FAAIVGSKTDLNRANLSELFEFLLVQNFLGFNWSVDSVLEEATKRDFWLLKSDSGKIRVLVIFQKLGDEAEIHFVMKAKDLSSEEVRGALEDFFNANGQVKKWWLEVHQSNFGAIFLYKKLGFTQEGLRLKYYSDGGGALILLKKAP
ncbi:MAG: hypothetical protein KDD45_08975, partial [Bdellovibrionales bacterium]|nr:hypothetical protein [Bdellovibrionales bacterium]